LVVCPVLVRRGEVPAARIAGGQPQNCGRRRNGRLGRLGARGVSGLQRSERAPGAARERERKRAPEQSTSHGWSSRKQPDWAPRTARPSRLVGAPDAGPFNERSGSDLKDALG